jgi:UDP-N-acetylmuramoyl-tripeptide--D-alanyl-D-alanine ligase
MIPMTLAEIADAVGGARHGADVTVTGPAFVDSRVAEPGGLFAAVAGEHVDGHEYAASALAAGAAAVLGLRPVDGPCVVVDDVVTALGRLARHVVDHLPDLTVLALTGSQGKTGTKDYLAQVLATAGPTVATAGNLNNELGVPLTVLRAEPETEFLVVEMGARGIGHVAYLREIAPPRVAAVINVGTAHMSEFGSREAIAQAKGEIVEALPEDGVAVLNADDDLVAAMADRTKARVVTFGELDPEAATTPTLGFHDLRQDELGRPSAAFHWHDDAVGGTTGARLTLRQITLRQIGRHQVANAAAAAAMALAAGLEFGQVATALEQATSLSRWRMELHERADGVAVINDAYNANPASMGAALQTLQDIHERSGRRTIAVLGEMKELGPGSPEEHRRVGERAAAVGVDVLLVIGEPARPMVDGANNITSWSGTALHLEDRASALAWLRENVAAGDVVLVKASRGAALETVAEGLLEGTDA